MIYRIYPTERKILVENTFEILQGATSSQATQQQPLLQPTGSRRLLRGEIFRMIILFKTNRYGRAESLLSNDSRIIGPYWDHVFKIQYFHQKNCNFFGGRKLSYNFSIDGKGRLSSFKIYSDSSKMSGKSCLITDNHAN